MASDNKDGKSKVPATTQSNSQAISGEHDLDKNPIQYATHEPGKTTTEPHDKAYMEMTLRASDKHSPLIQKLMRQRIELRAKEFPRWPGESSSGVRIMWIESRFWYDRERLSPDFDSDWRSYRAKYLQSLELDPREPVHVPEYEMEMINPIRRFYMRGGDWLENNVIRKFTSDKFKSAMYRVVFTRAIMLYFAAMGGYYWIRYTNKKWEHDSGPAISVSRPIIYPGDPRFPFKDYRTSPTHHHDMGFTRRTIYKDLSQFEDTTAIL